MCVCKDNTRLLNILFFVAVKLLLVSHVKFCLVVSALPGQTLATMSSFRVFIGRDDLIQVFDGACFLKLFFIHWQHEFHLLGAGRRYLADFSKSYMSVL